MKKHNVHSILGLSQQISVATVVRKGHMSWSDSKIIMTLVSESDYYTNLAIHYAMHYM